MQTSLTNREKVAHLLRRFGLGAGQYEVDRYEKLGVEGPLKALLDYADQDEGFPVSPWSFAVQSDRKLYTDPYQIAAWWSLRLLMTQRPLQERLTLFWHDHFAVSGEKVFEGPTMLGYLEILRGHGGGKFGHLLKSVSKHSALVTYLDNQTSTKSQPNENYAREMLELFTLGMGHYSEKDVKEAARAFTGWSTHYSGIGDETPYEKLAEQAARQGMSLFNFCEVPAHHDNGEKEFLGEKGRLNGDDVVRLIASRPETRQHLCRKLWEWFVAPEPDASVLKSVEDTWRTTDGDIKSVLKTIARHPAFWSTETVRSMPKSPVDFTISMFRALDLRSVFLSMIDPKKDDYEPVAEDVRKAGLGMFYLMSQQGLSLLFPPNVGGWEWGRAWITANNTVARVNHSSVIFWGEDTNRPLAVYLAERIRSSGRAGQASNIVDAVAEIFDAVPTPTERDLLIEACTRAGGPSNLGTKDGAAAVFAELSKVMFALPSFQLC